MPANWKSWFRAGLIDEELRKFDPFTHAVTVITENHRLIHDGMFFEFGQADATFPIGAEVDILISPPAGVFPHFQDIEISTNQAPINFDLYEGVTVSAAGTSIPPQNKNRNSSRAAETAITVSPTITDLGVNFKSGSVPIPSIAEVLREREWVLQPATLYLLRLANASGVVANLNVTIDFYELNYPEDGTQLDFPLQQ